MVAEKPTAPKAGAKNTWHKSRARIVQQITRTKLSTGAKLLWIELAMNWAWNDPVCFPSHDVLATGLGVGKNSITRWSRELEAAKLLRRVKVNREQRYYLADAMPDELVEQWKLSNQVLTQRVKKTRKSKKSDHDAVRSQSPKEGSSKHDRVLTVPILNEANHQNGDWVQDADPHPGDCEPFSIPKMGIATSTMKHLKQDEEEKKLDERDEAKRESQIHALEVTGVDSHEPSRGALGDEGSEPVRSDEINELMEDEEPIRPKSNNYRGKKRAPDRSFVPTAGRAGKAFPEADTGSVRGERVDLGPPPPPESFESPDGLLCVLRDEVQDRFGPVRSYPLELSTKLRGQFKNALIRKYPPDVLLDMIRVLVWDWEVAREVCFPGRNTTHPCPLSFVQYAKELAARVDSGFESPGHLRGRRNSYRERFIERQALVDDSDPF